MKLWCKYLFAAVILLFVFGAVAFAQSNPKITNIQAFDGYIRIEWQIVTEADVDHYEVWRSSGSSVALLVGNVQRGVFYFDDKNVNLYKAEDQFFSYQVKAIGSNPSLRSESEPMGIRYSRTSDAYKRTWGSIKAMFR